MISRLRPHRRFRFFSFLVLVGLSAAAAAAARADSVSAPSGGVGAFIRTLDQPVVGLADTVLTAGLGPELLEVSFGTLEANVLARQQFDVDDFGDAVIIHSSGDLYIDGGFFSRPREMGAYAEYGVDFAAAPGSVYTGFVLLGSEGEVRVSIVDLVPAAGDGVVFDETAVAGGPFFVFSGPLPGSGSYRFSYRTEAGYSPSPDGSFSTHTSFTVHFQVQRGAVGFESRSFGDVKALYR
ncbi:hypothetical protein KDM41_06910 [bacterium]|nr:hypothetical protein [bacterium]